MKDIRFKVCEGDKKYKLNPNSTDYDEDNQCVVAHKMGWASRSHIKHWRTKCRISANENKK